jgi:hypothetical protein
MRQLIVPTQSASKMPMAQKKSGGSGPQAKKTQSINKVYESSSKSLTKSSIGMKFGENANACTPTKYSVRTPGESTQIKPKLKTTSTPTVVGTYLGSKASAISAASVSGISGDIKVKLARLRQDQDHDTHSEMDESEDCSEADEMDQNCDETEQNENIVDRDGQTI